MLISRCSVKSPSTQLLLTNESDKTHLNRHCWHFCWHLRWHWNRQFPGSTIDAVIVLVADLDDEQLFRDRPMPNGQHILVCTKSPVDSDNLAMGGAGNDTIISAGLPKIVLFLASFGFLDSKP
jgi:hypothetical protein